MASQVPTHASTAVPTMLPSVFPTAVPTELPTLEPTVTPGYPTRAPVESPTHYPSHVPSVAPTIAPAVLWTNELQSVIAGISDVDTLDSDITAQTVYFELAVDGTSSYTLFGGCTPWAATVAELDTSALLYQTHSLELQVTYAANTALTEFISETVSCADSAPASAIVSKLVDNSNSLLDAVSIVCGSHSWVVKRCAISDPDPSICVDCPDPCLPTSHCVNTTSSSLIAAGNDELFPFTISPCVEQQCSSASADLQRSSAIRTLAIRFEDFDQAPSIRALAYNTTRSTIIVHATLSAPGALLCGVFRASASVPIDVASITLQQRFSGSSSTNTTSVVITGLIPATSYAVYCASASEIGTLLDLASVLETRAEVTTECCKTISLRLSSTSVVQSESVANLVTYTLSNLPSSTVTAALTGYRYTGEIGNSSLERVAGMFSPAIATITSTASTREKRASLNALDRGGYVFNVSLSGASSGEYEVVFTNAVDEGAQYQALTVFGWDEPPPAPELLAVYFSGDGSYLNIEFDSSTNRGFTTTQFPCSSLFSFACAPTSTCQWDDDSTVLAYIAGPQGDTSSCVEPNDILTIRSSAVITAACPSSADDCSDSLVASWPAASAITLTIDGPDADDAVSPTVAIVSPGTIGSCDDLTLDATSSIGSGGRPWASSTITVASTALNNITMLQNYLEASHSLFPASPIPTAVLNRGFSYTFYVTLCNFLNVCSVGNRRVTVQDSVVPLVTIGGAATRVIRPSDRLDVSATAVINSCGGGSTSAGLQFGWTVFENNVRNLGIVSISSNPAAFKLDAYTLEAGFTYRLVLAATITATLSTASTTVSVLVVPGDVVAVLASGTDRSVRLNDTITLDASPSYDEDIPDLTGVDAGLLFSWSCAQIAPIFADSCESLLQSGSGVFETFEVAPLHDAAAGAAGEITVVVSDAGGSRSAQSIITVTVLPALSPTVEVSSNLLGNAKLNTEQSLILTGVVSLPGAANGVATWTASDSSLDLEEISLSPLSTTIQSSASGGSTATATLYLAIQAGSLSGGSKLTFKLACAASILDVAGNIVDSASAAAGVNVVVNLPPRPGSFGVTPGVGTERQDDFRFSALQWQDNDLPLSYEFGYVSPQSKRVTMASKSSFTAGSSQLPAGLKASQYAVTCFALIYDSYNANTTSTTSIVVNPAPAVSIEEMQAYVNQVPESSNPDDVKQYSALSSALLNEVNCTLAPNCSALNRQECTTTAHTCGGCFSDEYILLGNDRPCIRLSDLAAELVTSANSSAAANITSRSCSLATDCYVYEVCAFDTAANVSSSSSSIGVCQLPSKECPGGCFGRGTCLHINADSGKLLGDCKVTESYCTAVCDCEEEYSLSEDCSLTKEEVGLKQDSRILVLQSILDLMETEDPDSEAIIGWINLLVVATEQVDELSTEGFQLVFNISNSIIDLAGDAGVPYTQVSVLLEALDSATKATLNSGERRRRRRLQMSPSEYRTLQSTEVNDGSGLALNNDIGNSLDALRKFGDLIAAALVPGQRPIQSILGEFRIAVEMLSPFTSSAGAIVDDGSGTGTVVSVSLPQTALEQSGSSAGSSISLAITSEVSASGVTLRSELYTSSGEFESSPFSMFLSDAPCSGDTCYAQILMQFSEPLDLSLYGSAEDITEETFVTECEANKKEVIPHTCANSFVLNVTCDYSEDTSVESQCPSTLLEPVCNRLGDAAVEAAAECEVVTYTATNITCGCNLQGSGSGGGGGGGGGGSSSISSTRAHHVLQYGPPRYHPRPRHGPRRMLQATDDGNGDDDGGDDEGYSVSYVAMTQSTVVSVGETYETAGDVNASTLKREWRVLVTMGVFLWAFIVFMIVGAYFDHKELKARKAARNAEKYSKESQQTQRPLVDERDIRLTAAAEVVQVAAEQREASRRSGVTPFHEKDGDDEGEGDNDDDDDEEGKPAVDWAESCTELKRKDFISTSNSGRLMSAKIMPQVTRLVSIIQRRSARKIIPLNPQTSDSTADFVSSRGASQAGVPKHKRRRIKVTNEGSKSTALSVHMHLIEESLPYVLQSKTLGDRLAVEMRNNHRWVSVWFHFSEEFPRTHRTLSLCTTVLTMLFFQSMTYNIADPDESTCEVHDSENACVSEQSQFQTGQSKCQWLASKEKCEFIQPDNSWQIMLFVAIFSAVLSTPIAIFTHWILEKILSAPDIEEGENDDDAHNNGDFSGGEALDNLPAVGFAKVKPQPRRQQQQQAGDSATAPAISAHVLRAMGIAVPSSAQAGSNRSVAPAASLAGATSAGGSGSYGLDLPLFVQVQRRCGLDLGALAEMNELSEGIKRHRMTLDAGKKEEFDCKCAWIKMFNAIQLYIDYNSNNIFLRSLLLFVTRILCFSRSPQYSGDWIEMATFEPMMMMMITKKTTKTSAMKLHEMAQVQVEMPTIQTSIMMLTARVVIWWWQDQAR